MPIEKIQLVKASKQRIISMSERLYQLDVP
jgi:hypothetical protein